MYMRSIRGLNGKLHHQLKISVDSLPASGWVCDVRHGVEDNTEEQSSA